MFIFFDYVSYLYSFALILTSIPMILPVVLLQYKHKSPSLIMAPISLLCQRHMMWWRTTGPDNFAHQLLLAPIETFHLIYTTADSLAI